MAGIKISIENQNFLGIDSSLGFFIDCVQQRCYFYVVVFLYPTALYKSISIDTLRRNNY